MATWIFQGNPNIFDVDGYLEQCDSFITWLVRQHAKDIVVGDTVFLWRSEGDGKQPGGVIAELEVIEPVRLQRDDPASLPFWKSEAGRAPDVEMTERVLLRLVRLASKREVLRRDWLKEDAVLKSLAPLKMAQHTNYRVKIEEVSRLRALWENTGRDWSREESVAALYAYDRSFNGPISKLESSPVSQIAQKIGRATGDVHNKLRNFRSIDPRVEEKVSEGSSVVDHAVWKEFFDETTITLRSDALQHEYDRLWAKAETPPLAESTREAIEAEAQRLESRGLDDLMRSFNAGRYGFEKPARQIGTVASYKRDPKVVAITRLRAGSRCEVPGCANHQFTSAEGKLYIEIHHLQMLSNGGADIPENTVAVCASHHRELHHGKQRVALNDTLTQMRRQSEQKVR